MKFDPYEYEHNRANHYLFTQTQVKGSSDLVVDKIVFVKYGKEETIIYTDSIAIEIQANGRQKDLVIFNSSISNSISQQLIFIGIPDIFKVRAFQL